MTTAITIMTDAEVQRCRQAWDGDEPGFGRLSTEKGNLPLAAVDVDAKIVGLLSEITLKQTFQNVHKEPLEATYIFPLPDRAAVTTFRMTVNGRVIEGLLKERGQARQDYDTAIAAGHRAAIAEEERPGTFTMRVGNLMPGEVAVITFGMTNPLPFVDGEATFRFPLVVAPRYIPGAPISGDPVGDGVATDTDAVPDASRITPPVLLPGFPNPVKLGINVEIDGAGLPLGGVKSSLHAISAQADGKNKQRLSINPGERANRDFVLRLGYGGDSVKSSLVVEEDKDGKGGTFALTLVPPVAASKAVKPRDVIFVLDRSGSMGGWKMVASRRACARMVDTLNDSDRFTVYAFDDSIEAPAAFNGNGLAPATDRNRFRAIEFLATVDARGGTEMAAPLDLAVTTLSSDASQGGGVGAPEHPHGEAAGSPKGDQGRTKVLVMITDGQVGNEDQILRMLGNRVAGMRIFTVGIDSAVNEGFLKRLAGIGGGACELLESEDRLDEAMDRIHTRIGTSCLTELKVEPAGLKVEKDSIVPARFPALFAGAPLVITGRYKGKAPKGEAGIALQATDAHGAHWTETLRVTDHKGRAVGQAWARGHLRDLEDRYVISSDASLEKRILEVSLEFTVLCRFTAFVAVDKSEVVNVGGKNVKVTQPVDAPEGWAMFDAEGATGSVDKKEMAKDMMARSRGSFGAGAPGGAAMGGKASNGAMPPPAPMEAEEDLQAAEKSVAPASRSVSAKKPMAPPVQAQSTPVPKPAPASAAAPAKRRQSTLSRILGKSDDAGVEEATPSIDLTPYRRRAAELVDAIRKASTEPEDARLAALGEVTVKLKALVEDLESIGADPAEVKPLAELRKELLKLLAAKKPDVAAGSAKALSTLEAFVGAGGKAPATEPKRRGVAFWK